MRIDLKREGDKFLKLTLQILICTLLHFKLKGLYPSKKELKEQR
ncbi:hypothetical protein AVDCRST_MAG92-66 [uncultured Coleofasciculus sp.]|uniref:Uncharacterized protein n=1 Tax=uncultured Coleofasciculus sp. TaxID=1267456 RepID=A0A6J4H156_9CYAN|nr:hypothetical protein AVDCRST_MAG92-66 [uncultured Coleofasciculus sp.]